MYFYLRTIAIIILISCRVTVQENSDSQDPDSGVCLPSNVCDRLRALEARDSEFRRRINSLEQDVWKISSDNLRWSACSEGPCRCSAPNYVVNCWRLSLTEIPGQQTLPKDTITLDLGSNKIASIHKYTFKGLFNLVQLDLSNNELDYLPDSIFEKLESLKYLMLQQNKIQSLGGSIFQDLKYLVTLDLSDNQLSNFQASQLSGLNSLTMLLLSRNRLTSWGSFDGLGVLEELDLSENTISRLTGLSTLKNLKRLKFGNNQLAFLLPETFKGLNKLEILSLQKNLLEDLPLGVFKDLRSLQSLDLAENFLTEVVQEQFEGLSKLEELYLNKNMLEGIRNSTFLELPALERLLLPGNNIGFLEEDAFEGLGNLSILVLTNNIIEKINAGTFQTVTNLTRLELDSNKIKCIEKEGLENLKLLKTIKLGKNAWECDCDILYLANWIRDNSLMVFEYQPKCRGPGDLAGQPLYSMSFADVCDGNWMSTQNFPARIGVSLNQ